MKTATLVFPIHYTSDGVTRTRVLLGLKKKGFGKLKWNGFGGKVQPGESIPQAACRELEEECGLGTDPEKLIPAAVITFRFDGRKEWNQVVHVYLVEDFCNEPEESDEMKPCWFYMDELPKKRMWIDDAYWLGPVLEGNYPVNGMFMFNEDGSKILHMTLDFNVD